jgi:hypothetical protein
LHLSLLNEPNHDRNYSLIHSLSSFSCFQRRFSR